MEMDLTDLLYALSFALDRVEQELTGVATGHGKRVAYLSILMGKEWGMEQEELVDFVGCAILHDNALTEFISEELHNDVLTLGNGKYPESAKSHCVVGEENIRLLPFRTDVKNIVLYHHENADGSGMMGKKAGEVPMKSQILHLADTIDMRWKLEKLSRNEYMQMMSQMESESGSLFSQECISLFRQAVNFGTICKMQKVGVDACLREMLPAQYEEYTGEEIHRIAMLFAKIVDYKSPFTRRHSAGVAKKAEIMAEYYHYPPEKTLRYYLAAAMHDIGKLVVQNRILEKPGKLNEQEFGQIKNHAMATYKILEQIKGLEDITAWAGHHHEKLDGRGYPFGLKEEDLSQEERLMACIDIYQALTEPRPYKDGMKHEKAIDIMRDMADKGQIDGEIVNDIAYCMKGRA